MSTDNTKKHKSSRSPSQGIAGRRRFLAATAASAAGAATLGFPMISRAATTTMRFQSTWPTKDIFHEYALDFAKKVNEMSGGRLKIDVLPAGAVVKAFDLIDAVNKGTLDGGHGVTAYWYGKNAAYSLFGTGPSFGMDANTLLAWVEYGGGRALYDELQHSIMKFDIVGFLYGPMPTQPLGWFKKQVKSPADLKNLKYRTVGLSVDVFKEMGASVVALPGGEIVPALDRGVIEAAEFNNASSDRLLGFPDVSKICMLQSYHQPLEIFEILFNKKKYNSLPTELKAIIRYAAQALECRHVVEGDRPLLLGLHRNADQAGCKILQDAGKHSQGATCRVGQGGGDQEQGQCVLRQGARVAEEICTTCGQVGPGHHCQPGPCRGALFRQEEGVVSYR